MKDLFLDTQQERIKDSFPILKEIYDNEEFSKKQKSLKIRKVLVDCADGAKFHFLEDLLIEVEIEFRTEVLTGHLDKLPPQTQWVERLRDIIKHKFSEEPELMEIILESIPDMENIRRWTKRPQWKQEVEARMRDETLFSTENRHRMIRAVYENGLKGNAKFAEMYLKMSGDIGAPEKEDPKRKAYENILDSMTKKK
jgi:hypothetical protein